MGYKFSKFLIRKIAKLKFPLMFDVKSHVKKSLNIMYVLLPDESSTDFVRKLVS
mgnify:CR=1 FL=1